MISRTAFCSAQPLTMRALAADALDLGEASGLGLDDLEHRLAEGGDDALGHHRADAPHLAGSEVALDALDPGRRRHLERVGAELEAVLAIRDPTPCRRQPLARGDGGSVAHHRHEVAPAAGMDLEDAEAGLGTVERHALHRTGQHVEIGRPDRRVHALTPSWFRKDESFRGSRAEPW
jgi:hypothetical protein